MMRDPEFFLFYRNHYSLFNTIFEWEKEILYRVEDPAGWIRSLKIELDEYYRSKNLCSTKHPMFRTSLRLFFNVMTRFIQDKVRARRKTTITDKSDFFSKILCCPHCKLSLDVQWDEKKIECHHCSRVFPILGEIPILLSDKKDVKDVKERWKRYYA